MAIETSLYYEARSEKTLKYVDVLYFYFDVKKLVLNFVKMFYVTPCTYGAVSPVHATKAGRGEWKLALFILQL